MVTPDTDWFCVHGKSLRSLSSAHEKWGQKQKCYMFSINIYKNTNNKIIYFIFYIYIYIYIIYLYIYIYIYILFILIEYYCFIYIYIN